MTALSLIAPVFDEAEGIEAFVREALAALDPLDPAAELICVDDGWRNATRRILERLAGQQPRLRPIALGAHRGQSAAIARGIAVARGGLIALIDADGQNDPRDLGPMLRLLESAAVDCVLGVRARRQDPWRRRASSRVANAVANRILGSATRDACCGLKLLRAPLARRLPWFDGAHRFIGPLVTMAGGTLAELEVGHRPRRAGVSKYGHGLGRAVVAFTDALGVRWLRARRLPDLSG
jgi:glycosyltransferase involved in cell wall biosynthesis